MADATQIVIDDSFVYQAARQTVSVREHWKDQWTNEKHLFCSNARLAAGPTVPTASLAWDFGIGLRPGELQFALHEWLDLLGWFVRTVIQPLGPNGLAFDGDGQALDPITWIGRILGEGTVRHGAILNDSQERALNGGQSLVAYGLVILLDQQRITTCWYESEAGKEAELGRALDFNPPNRFGDKGNRSAAVGPRGVYIFAGDLDTGEYWTTVDIVQYLLEYHQPVDETGNVSIEWALEGASMGFLPDWDRPRLRLHGQTLKRILDDLLDRRRLLSYTVELDEGGGADDADAMLLRPFNFADEAITLPDEEAHEIFANEDQVAIDFDTRHDVDQAVLQRTKFQSYDQVVAVGDQVLCCGTIAAEDSTLVAHWSAAQDTAFENASKDEGDYPADVNARQQRNRAFRRGETMQRVYSWFGLPADWDGRVGDGVGGAKNDLFPYDELGVDKEKTAVWFAPGLRFERGLPLKTDHDYSDGNIPDAITDGTPTGRSWEYRPLLVAIETPDDLTGGVADRFEEVDKLASSAACEDTGDGGGRDWACSVRVQDEAPGIIVRVIGGEGQQVIATADFTPHADCDDVDEIGAFDWNHNLLATIAIRADYHLREVWPAELEGQDDTIRRLYLDAGNRAQLHYVAPGTTVHLSDTLLKKSTGGGLIRDDREWLSNVARIAHEWFGTPRQALRLRLQRATGVFSLGQLVVTLGSGGTEESVRTVITEIDIALGSADSQPDYTSIRTQWAELDVLNLVGEPIEQTAHVGARLLAGGGA